MFGAPQGSIMGPEDYKIYTLPVGDILRKYLIEFHIYADDTQSYDSFQLSDPNSLIKLTDKLTLCMEEIKLWMSENKLKLNDSKTEVMLIIPPNWKNKIHMDTLRIGDAAITPTYYAKNIGEIGRAHV